MSANLNALVPLASAAREIPMLEAEIQALTDSDAIEVMGGHGYIYRYSVDRLKARAARFGGTGQ